jgi:Protein of unknown function DUF115
MISKIIIKYSEKWIRTLEKFNSFLFRQSKNFKKDSILKKNILLKNTYKSKKCYIIGNSPSLNNHDLLLLENENVFCLNTFFVHKDFDKIKPNFYVFADPDLYNLDENIKEWWEKLIKKSINKNISYFLPIQLKNTFIHEKLIHEKIYFIDLSLPFNNQSVKYFDLSKPVNGVQNVLILSVQIAVFMGFEEIYLLGADHDWMSHFGNEQRHFYSNDETKVENVGTTGYPYNWWLDAVNTMFSQYKLIKKRLDKKTNVKIFNASESGVLDIFPAIRFKDTF